MTDCTREAAAVWRAVIGISWPKGWKCVLRPNARAKHFGIANYTHKTIVIYTHSNFNECLDTLLHEFVHVLTDSNLHDKRFYAILKALHRNRGPACVSVSL
jgi:hypothetical protein